MREGYQSSSTRQGTEFEAAVEVWLKIAGWNIENSGTLGNRLRVGDASIDIVAVDPAGVRWWIECKGSWEGPEPNRGGRRGDTIKKAIAVAWWLAQLEDRCPYMLIASHLPAAHTLPGKMLRRAGELGLFDRIETIHSLSRVAP